MKFDCGGAAAVFGAARAIAKLAPEGVEVHFVVAACEVGTDSFECVGSLLYQTDVSQFYRCVFCNPFLSPEYDQ